MFSHHGYDGSIFETVTDDETGYESANDRMPTTMSDTNLH